MHEFCGENEHTNAFTGSARLCTVCVVIACRRWNGLVWGVRGGGDPPYMLCVAPFLGFALWVVALVMLQQGGRGERGEGRGLYLFALTESTSHIARATGGKAREGEREWERESECARVSRVCAWIAPPHPVHRFCRRPCSDGENHADKPFFPLRFIRHHGIPDVTDRSFMSPALSPAPFISERLWHHGFGYGTYK